MYKDIRCYLVECGNSSAFSPTSVIVVWNCPTGIAGGAEFDYDMTLFRDL